MSKTSARRIRQQQRLEREQSAGRMFLTAVVVVLSALLVALAVGWGSKPSPPSTKAEAEGRSGSAAALDLVADTKTVALGHVPLNQTVTPRWKLTNTGGGTVVLGKPHAEVIEGCCPGPLQLGSAKLAAGKSTELAYPLQMHPGMDGPHEFSIHIPVERDGAEETLELRTTGHFST